MNIHLTNDETREILQIIRNKIDYKFIETLRKEILETIYSDLRNRDIRNLVQEEVRAQLKKVRKNEI